MDICVPLSGDRGLLKHFLKAATASPKVVVKAPSVTSKVSPSKGKEAVPLSPFVETKAYGCLSSCCVRQLCPTGESKVLLKSGAETTPEDSTQPLW